MLCGLKASRVLLEIMVDQEFQAGKAREVIPAFLVVTVRFSSVL